jgi:hypothetical protein
MDKTSKERIGGSDDSRSPEGAADAPQRALGEEASSGGSTGAGQSGGGAYPNPHKGKDGGGDTGWMGHGGQSEMAYHGAGQIGTDRVGDNPNAPARNKREEKD